MQTNILTIDELVSPLIELLNRNYSVDPNEPYEIPPFGQFGVLEENPDETTIVLPDAILSNEMATRAIATLLWRTGSNALRTETRFSEADPYRTPLRFALLKRAFWLGHLQWDRYLIIDHLDEEVDAEAAEQQIQLLTDYLRQASNLVALEPDDLAMF